jgi:hypothetical protein
MRGPDAIRVATGEFMPSCPTGGADMQSVLLTLIKVLGTILLWEVLSQASVRNYISKVRSMVMINQRKTQGP